MITRRLLLSSLALAPGFTPLALAQAPAPAAAGPMPVVATFSILADLVRAIGAERVAVTSLVGVDSDAHAYAPSPADARTIAGAKLVFVNGLGFEGWINRLIRSSGTRAKVITASTGVVALKAEDDHGHGHGHGHGHSHGENDPHAWQNALFVKTYVRTIRDALVAADPAGAALFTGNAAAYSASLDALDAEIKAAVARIPAERRRILTTHDAFQYFQKAYGIAFVALRGVASDAEPSARDLGQIIRQIKQGRITAIFMENITDPRAMQRIASETGVRVGGKLYSDALSAADGPASTYLDMMRHNIGQISGALAQA
ncbi:metal ABC transporter solute-binding protein, Zn/Mn family [Phreatobacter stygius]|uniref:Metal ABC transporter substrate-binding protein n=1 Tax=Phreatobacter stygius TaxID=1940610 RepID=A0A4D7AZP9_9HYPH|nr:zinc ABC transporter substrate-binding protein [Phreatobacter stygius]QCI64243.1 metal ABC transporter substrate-binding protein [Phreatobacter stygius]